MKKQVLQLLVILALSMSMLLGSVSQGMGSLKSSSEIKGSEQTMYVAIRQITLHKSASNGNNAEVIPYREKITVCDAYDTSARWVHVKYKGQDRYFYNQPGVEFLKKEMDDPFAGGNTKYQKEMLKLAKTIVEDWKTVYTGGESEGVKRPDGYYGFDCSGLASYVMNTVMQKYVPTFRVSKNLDTMYATKSVYSKGLKGECKVKTICEGTYDESKLEPGDILFFMMESASDSAGRACTHCSIYLGHGEMVHATWAFDKKVRVMPVDDYYQGTGTVENSYRFVAAKRFVPQKVEPANETFYTAKSYTSFYKGTGAGQKAIKTYGLLKKVTVLYTDNGNWAQVKMPNGKKGYVLLRNICKDMDKGISCKVRNSGLMLYKSASRSSKHITLSRGKKLTLHKNMGKGFYKVKYQSKYYYVYAPNGIDDAISA